MSAHYGDPLSRMEQVSVRDVWADEARHFTPWLGRSENIGLLGEAIGLQLEVETQERSVGPFRADILCKDVTDDSWVLIENQLERTDHIHLGQLLTYAAGLDAVTIVWVAQQFTEEHRAALDWLNDKTPEGIAFFGLEIELWRIADSPVAPKFNVTCKPNEWTRTVQIDKRNDPERAALCYEYWQGVLDALGPSDILSTESKPMRKQDIVFPVGWRSFWIKAYFSRPKRLVGVWVACRGSHGADNFFALEKKKDAIETDFGDTLEWNLDEEKNTGTCIKIYSDMDPENRDDWQRQHRFIAEKLTALYKAVAPFVSTLDTQAPHGT